MKVSTHLLPPPLSGISIDGGLAIVIDVLRATSVMTTAIDSGAKSVTTFADIPSARQYARQLSADGHSPFLGGERECQPIDGFDAGNSPREYGSALRGRPVIITTTNGTRAIESASDADEMLAASFLNLSAVAGAAKTHDRIHLVCSGTNGQITREDVLLAGALIEKWQSQSIAIERCDSSDLAHTAWHAAMNGNATPETLARQLAGGLGGRNLVIAGYQADFERCAAIDQCNSIAKRVSVGPARFESFG